MDKERQIRFLYPPFFLVASILIGLYFDPTKSISELLPISDSNFNIGQIIAILVGGGLFILVIGFLIGTVTVTALRFVFFLFGRKHYEIVLSDSAYDRIKQMVLNPEDRLKKRERIYAAVTFDHEILPAGVHSWIVRRWNAFYVCTNSFVALTISLLAGYLIDLHMTFNWLMLTIVAAILLLINGIIAWRETMYMLEFQSRRKLIPKKINNSLQEGDEEQSAY